MAPTPFVILALGALGAALIVRRLVNQWGKVGAEQAKDAAVEAEKRESLPKLRRGSDGVYRP